MHIIGRVKRGKYTPNAAKHVAYMAGSNRRIDGRNMAAGHRERYRNGEHNANERNKTRMRDVGDSMDDVQSHGGVTEGGAVI
jgi:hypothetical protein